MHEMSVALSIIEAVDEKARLEGAGRISEIELVVGRLAGIDAESLKFCFSAAARDSLAEHAVLAVREREGQGLCTACGSSFPLAFHIAECPVCRSFSVRIVSGDEFFIQSITIEEKE
ncbi:MAG: hydrogenase maturation nickel metallochaperone HypA [Chlorobi bacterium]|nr:hydrogenase maturation nickel metallochaperone HypA [Chlorobiota bacterium]